jgi:hypothetical protein
VSFSPTDLADDTDFERLVISRLGVARPDQDTTG